MLQFSLLGGLGVAVDGLPAKIALPRRGVALLAYVLMHGAVRLQRERLAVTLWPDEIESDGRAKLRRMLYLLGQSCPAAGSADWLVIDAASIVWNSAVTRTLDVERLREAIRAKAPVDTASIYRGDLLPDFDDEWMLPERDRLRDGHVQNLERLAKDRRAAGNAPEARAACLELLVLEPWREDVMRLVIEMRAAGGDRAGALAEYDRFEARLREELGVDPMPETVAIRERLLAEAAAPVVQKRAAPASAPPVAVESDRVFVGRERELAMLAERFTEAESGRGGLVLIGGESGVGKSELIARHARHVAERGGAVILVETTVIETRPYQPFVAALDRALHELAGNLPPTTRSAIDRLLPGASLDDLVEVQTERESTLERTRLFEAVATTLDTLAAKRPLLLVLEDVHFAASGTMALLEYVARRAARSAMLVVASYRDGDVSRTHPLRALRRRMREEALVAHLALAPLQPKDVARYLEIVAVDATPDQVASITTASGGLPMILVELAGAPDLGSASLPTSLVTKSVTLMNRLDGLPAQVRTLLEIAAVIGLGFDVELLVEVSGWSEAETYQHLSAAVGRRVVREVARGGYDFAHDLFREIVYDAMPPAIRARRHALVAEALQDLNSLTPEELSSTLATHFERAGDSRRAIVALHSAARRALALFAHDDAAEFATRALDQGAGGQTAIELLFVRESASRFAGLRDRQRDDLDRCESLLGPVVDSALWCEFLRRRLTLEHDTGQRESERLTLERFIRMAEPAAGAWPSRAALCAGKHAFDAGRHADARVSLERAAEGFERAADPYGIFETTVALAACERLAGDVTTLEAHFARAESQLLSLHDARHLIAALYEERAKTAEVLQRFAEMDLWAQRLLEAAVETGDVVRRAQAHELLAGAAAFRLQIARAYKHLSEASDISEMIGDHQRTYSVMAFRAILETRIGSWEQATASFERAREIARSFELDFGDGACSLNLAHCYTELGRPAEAYESASAALQLAARIGADIMRAPALVNYAVALRDLGRPGEALAPIVEACESAERERRLELAAEAWSERAHISALMGDRSAAIAAADRARALLVEVSPSTRPAARYNSLSTTYLLLGDDKSASLMKREGVDLLHKQLVAFPDDLSRRTFVATKAHQALLEGEPDVLRTVRA